MVRTIDEIERICGEDVGRNIGKMVSSAKGGMERAAQSLAHGRRGCVAIATGCFIPIGERGSAETDGPIGAVVLARALQSVGHRVVLLTDPYCSDVVQVARSSVNDWLSVVPIGVISNDSQEPEYVDEEPPEAALTHLVAIERLGPGFDGHIRSMSGELRDDVSGDVDTFFERSSAFKIGIGDGGNELGMGSLRSEIVSSSVALGPEIRCVVPCDALIVAGCSNWGAYGLAASISVLRPNLNFQSLLSIETHHRILESIVKIGGSVDGMTSKSELTVDGMPETKLNAKLKNVLELIVGEQ